MDKEQSQAKQIRYGDFYYVNFYYGDVLKFYH